MLSTAGRRQVHALADLAVGEALELAQDEDPVMGLGELVEGAAQVLERSLSTSALSGAAEPTRRRRSAGRSAPSASIETSSVRLVRRWRSMAALRAIS